MISKNKFVIKPLSWTDERQPNDDCPYNHCMAETPFGRFLLTWKGWKNRPSSTMGFDETPWNDAWYGYWDSVEDAKNDAEKRLLELISLMVEAG